MVIHDAEADKKYVKQPVALDDGIEAFVAAFQAGELKPLIKSEAVPADNSGPVKVLVADNWEAMVQAGKTYMLARARAWPGPGAQGASARTIPRISCVAPGHFRIFHAVGAR